MGRCWILCKKSKITHFFYPFCKLQNLIHIIHKGSIIRNDWALEKSSAIWLGFFRRHKCRTCGRRESSISQPLSLRDIPFQGNTDHSLRSGRASSRLDVLRTSRTRVPRRRSAFAMLESQSVSSRVVIPVFLPMMYVYLFSVPAL